jgi:hypothetical protein
MSELESYIDKQVNALMSVGIPMDELKDLGDDLAPAIRNLKGLNALNIKKENGKAMAYLTRDGALYALGIKMPQEIILERLKEGEILVADEDDTNLRWASPYPKVNL